MIGGVSFRRCRGHRCGRNETHTAVSRLCPLQELLSTWRHWQTRSEATRHTCMQTSVIGVNRDRNHMDSWVRVCHKMLVCESDEQGGLPNLGIACGQEPPTRRCVRMIIGVLI